MSPATAGIPILCISFRNLAVLHALLGVIRLSCCTATLHLCLTRLPSIGGHRRRRSLLPSIGPAAWFINHAVFLPRDFDATGSEQAAGRHGYRFARANHQVIEHTHAHQLQGIAQFVGDRAIGSAGFGHAGKTVRVSS